MASPEIGNDLGLKAEADSISSIGNQDFEDYTKTLSEIHKTERSEDAQFHSGNITCEDERPSSNLLGSPLAGSDCDVVSRKEDHIDPMMNDDDNQKARDHSISNDCVTKPDRPFNPDDPTITLHDVTDEKYLLPKDGADENQMIYASENLSPVQVCEGSKFPKLDDGINLEPADSNSGYEEAERMLFEEEPSENQPSDGTAKCEYCQAVGSQDAFYSKSKRFCKMECSKRYSALFQKKGPGSRVPSNSSENHNANSKKRKSFKTPVRLKKPKLDAPVFHEPAVIEEDSSANDNIDEADDTSLNSWFDQDFNWKEYLETNNDKVAPEVFFKHTLKAQCLNEAHIGMKVELANNAHEARDEPINETKETLYWVASVINVEQQAMLLRYEGYDEDDSLDFWYDARKIVHPVGWCYSVQRRLVPPTIVKSKHTNWQQFLFSRLSGSRTFSSESLDRIQKGHFNKFEIGSKVEVADKHNLLSMCVATIVDIAGDRLRLRYDGLDVDSADDYWIHYLSSDIHPVGWSQLVGHTLSPPVGWGDSLTEWNEFLAEDLQESKDAAQECFVPYSMGTAPSASGSFEVGMKLESIDPVNPLCISVATVLQTLKFNYLVIGLDSQSTQFICHASSRSIYPVGWCKQNNVFLTPPKDMSGRPFEWSKYLQKTSSIPAPSRLFLNLNLKRFNPYETGMKLEAVDLREPSFICPATVSEIRGSLLRIHFDGWDPTFDQWADFDSLDIFPVEWCEKNSHPLQPPGSLIPDPVLENLRLSKTSGSVASSSQRGRNPSSRPPGRPPVHRPPHLVNRSSAGRGPSSGKAPTTGKGSSSGKGAKGGKGKHGKVKRNSGGSTTANYERQRFGNLREMRKGGEVQFAFNQNCACGPFLNPEEIRKMPDTISGYLNGPPHQNCIRKSLHEIVNAAIDPNQLLELFSREFYQSKKHKDLKLDNVVCLEITGRNGKRFLRRVKGPSRSGILGKYLQRICEMLQCCPNLIVEERFPSGKCTINCLEIFSAGATPLTTTSTPQSIENFSNKQVHEHSLEEYHSESSMAMINTIDTQSEQLSYDPPLLGNEFDTPSLNSTVTSSSQISSPMDSPCGPSSSTTDRGIDPLNLLDQEFLSTQDPREWTTKEVMDFMTAIGCAAHAATFQKQEIDGKALFLLSFDELESLTENKLGPITKLKDAIHSLKKMWQIQTPTS